MKGSKTDTIIDLKNKTVLPGSTWYGRWTWSVERSFLTGIIAVDENPEKNVATLEKVVLVMKNGVVYTK